MSKINIKATRDGFRRAGRVFTREGETFDSTDFSKEELIAIKADKSLFVTESKQTKVEADAEEKANTGGNK